MSFNVLVVPEDFTKDEHILKPLVVKILEEAGRPRATVQVCRDPNFQGVSNAMNIGRLKDEVIRRYPMVDLFLLFVDRDGVSGRETQATRIEEDLTPELKGRQKRFLAALAHQEVEVFILAGHELPPGWPWQQVRADPDVKNSCFSDLVRLKNTANQPHEGRKSLMAEAIANWSRIKSRCPEDVGTLIEKLQRQ
jgi:hypothetical protein